MSTTPVNTTDGSPFADLVHSFANQVAEKFSPGVSAQPEDQLKDPVGDLLSDVGSLENLAVSWRTEVHADEVVGRPDIGVITDGLLTGHVELKSPGTGADPEQFTGHNKDQWQRFKALPNLIYTDGSDWSLYRSGKLATRIRVAPDVGKGGAKAIDPSSLAEHHKMLRDFLRWNPVVPGTARGLAEFLAPLARVLRDEVKSELTKPDSPLHSLAKEWSGLLFPEGDESQFADAYAQTLTYALLLARFEGAESLRPALAVDALQREHGLLAEALWLLEAGPVRDALKMPIELLERAIGAVDSAKMSSGGDPWLYFYEQFLSAYDPKLRNDRGVYYTPVEVVRAQVRLAGELLRNRFGKQLGYAADDVVVLDPAVGTGTYPLAVLDHAANMVVDWQGPGQIAEKLGGLTNRLYAFELLVGPYSVAHLRLSQRLKEAGIANAVPRVYLTDTLESPNQLSEFTASVWQARMTDERTRAQAVKKDARVFVCLGNPPYDREERDPSDDIGQRKGGWVRHGDKGPNPLEPILEDFLAPARDAGQGIHLKNLYNDYVYFWRWALWKVFDSTGDAGIVTFITASSYLRGPGFVGMRRKMREVFDELWIIDLEGDSLGTRKTDNVFSIRTPVAIAIGVRDGEPRPDVPARVWKTRLTGSAAEKLSILDSVNSFDELAWDECASEWDEPFYPAGAGAYFSWPALIDVFPWQHSGSQLKRSWPIGETAEVLVNRWHKLRQSRPSQRAAMFKETRDRKVLRQYPRLRDGESRDQAITSISAETEAPPIACYSFRALDRHFVFADSRVGDFMRPDLWRAHDDQQVYLTGLLTDVLGRGPAVVASAEVPDLHHFNGRGAKDVIPLWRDAGATQPNITAGALEALGTVTHRRCPQSVSLPMPTASWPNLLTLNAFGTSWSNRLQGCPSPGTPIFSGAWPTTGQGFCTCIPTGPDLPVQTTTAPCLTARLDAKRASRRTNIRPAALTIRRPACCGWATENSRRYLRRCGTIRFPECRWSNHGSTVASSSAPGESLLRWMISGLNNGHSPTIFSTCSGCWRPLSIFSRKARLCWKRYAHPICSSRMSCRCRLTKSASLRKTLPQSASRSNCLPRSNRTTFTGFYDWSGLGRVDHKAVPILIIRQSRKS